MDFIAATKLLIQLLPLIIEAMKLVEQTLPAGTPGAQKLEMVKQILVQANTVASNPMTTFEKLWPAISGTITALVTTFNATGVFKK
jgi:hypothetical protein